MVDLVIGGPQGGKFKAHRTSMTSDEIFMLERDRIFDRCWL